MDFPLVFFIRLIERNVASLLLKMTLLRTNNSISTRNKLNYRILNVQIIVKSTVVMVLSIYSDKVDKVQMEITLRQGFVRCLGPAPSLLHYL